MDIRNIIPDDWYEAPECEEDNIEDERLEQLTDRMLEDELF